MSLKIWLPLNNNINNQGLTDWTPTIQSGTTATYVNGKIGKALHTGGIIMPASVTKEVLNNNEFSYACWLYVNATDPTTDRAMIFGNNNGRQFSMFQYPSANDFHYSWANYENGTWSSNCGGVLYDVLPSNQWTHIAVVYNNNITDKLKIYINGVSQTLSISSFVSKSTSFEFDTQLVHNSTYHYLNDVRLYDHALSAKEVSELAKGLVLHYRLSGIGGENLAKNTSLPTSTNGDLYTLSSTIPSGTKVTISCRIDADNVVLSGNKRIGLSSSMSKTDGSGTYWFETWIAYGNGLISENGSFHGHISNTTIIPGNMSNIGAYIQDLSSGTVSISEIKVEVSDHRTPWCPNPSDHEYSTMGLDDNIEYDCSGFGNNGMKVNTTIEIDTPRYTTSYGFTGSNSYVKTVDNNWISRPAEQITINMWAYKDDWTTYGGQRLFSCTEVAGFNTEQLNSSISFPVNVYTNEARSSRGYTASDYRPLISLSSLASGWHMFTFIYTTQRIAAYVDGELVDNRDYISYGAYCGDNIPLCIGAEATTNGVAGGMFIGKISDFRMYYTELNDADILSLYNLGGSIDNNGVFHTYEYVEV